MCIIIVCPPHKKPDTENLIQAMWENDDGSGWMIRTPHGLEIVRSARGVDHVLSTFKEARERWPDSWAVWHSRIATHRDVNDENTHPFIVPGTPWALAHNGILPLNDGPFRDDRSDSRILAEDHISTISWENLREIKGDFEKWLKGDKVVLMSGQKEKGGPVIIFNEKLGKWDTGDECWYSHPLYWPKSYASGGWTSTAKHYKSSFDDEDGIDWEANDFRPDASTSLVPLWAGDECPDCAGILIDIAQPGVLMCQECLEMWDDDYMREISDAEMSAQEEQEMYDAMNDAERAAMYAQVFASSLAETDDVDDAVIVEDFPVPLTPEQQTDRTRAIAIAAAHAAGQSKLPVHGLPVMVGADA